jgi:hypothetical protein
VTGLVPTDPHANHARHRKRNSSDLSSHAAANCGPHPRSASAFRGNQDVRFRPGPIVDAGSKESFRAAEEAAVSGDSSPAVFKLIDVTTRA